MSREKKLNIQNILCFDPSVEFCNIYEAVLQRLNNFLKLYLWQVTKREIV